MSKSKGRSRNRPHTRDFKIAAVGRMEKGEGIASLSRQLKVRRSVLYRWREIFRQSGAAGLRGPGRPGGQGLGPGRGEQGPDQRIAQLERKVGQQTLVIDFLQRAFKRVKESRQKSNGSGATASTERSER